MIFHVTDLNRFEMSTQTDQARLTQVIYLPKVSETCVENWVTRYGSSLDGSDTSDTSDTSKDDPLDCKFGGTPFMSEGEKWPTCSCNNSMEFAIQVNLWQFYDIKPTEEMWGSSLWDSDRNDIDERNKIYGDGFNYGFANMHVMMDSE